MIQVQGDIWKQEADVIVLTTNGYVRRDGQAVMGRGVAQQARDMFADRNPPLGKVLGNRLKSSGNHVHDLGQWDEYHIVSFPVKEFWRDKANTDLIVRSVEELLRLVEEKGFNTVALVRPGCGNGQLEWKEVEPLLDKLDERFTICEWLLTQT